MSASAPAPPDPWDDQPSTSKSIAISAAAAAVPKPSRGVVDDWEDDSDSDVDADAGGGGEAERDTRNQKIWENANTRAPMPHLVLSSSSTTQPPTSLPPAIFQAPIRILKRNPASASASPSPGQSGAGTPAQESLAEREARYQAARQRIFADTVESGDASRGAANTLGLQGGGKAGGERDQAQVGVIRNPLGPGAAAGAADERRSASRGFGGRRKRGSGSGSASPRVPPRMG
ncbi:hypothetical protein DENSPDRAFT_931638 [Dentipellis sp. KUC8613]|nr:hypothetical protein DENSPDRAFT_931638 [Dentipellis sp. KUC8613]